MVIFLTSFLKQRDGEKGTLSTTYILDKLGDFSYPVGKKLAKRHKMKFSGADSVWKDHKPTLLRMTFQLWQKDPLDVKAARRIAVDCLDEYRNQINNSELVLAPYLSHFPFTNNDIYIVIFCADQTGRTLYDPAISVISASRGKLQYTTNDPEKKYSYKSEYEETYEEAKEILKNEASGG